MLVVVGLIIAFLLVVLLSNRATRACRWREYRPSSTVERRRWHCVACGAEVVTSDSRPPRVCHARKGR